MNYDYSLTYFPSTDGKSSVAAHIFAPKNQPIRGIVQLAHGMVDHVLRYEELASYLTSHGYVFAGNDHLGHGLTAASNDELGYFAQRDSISYLLRDMHTLNRRLRDTYGKKPTILGHSMGSFLSRLYVAKYPNSVSGHIIHGTGGPMGPILPLGKALVRILIALKGERHRSSFVKKLSFSGYNSKFPKSEGANAWLSSDIERVRNKGENAREGFTFTLAAYRDLFSMVGYSNCGKWYAEYPKSVRTLVMSGDMDPVGKYGAGPTHVYKHLLISGAERVSLKLYKNARHELFNEVCRGEVFSDIVSWLEASAE